jgi:hypothetical protein
MTSSLNARGDFYEIDTNNFCFFANFARKSNLIFT